MLFVGVFTELAEPAAWLAILPQSDRFAITPPRALQKGALWEVSGGWGEENQPWSVGFLGKSRETQRKASNRYQPDNRDFL